MEVQPVEEHCEGESIRRCDGVERFSVFCLLRSCLTVTFSILLTIFLPLILGMLALPVSISSQCRIVSSGVDLRLSRVCELALPYCNAKYVRCSSGQPKILCYDDYYWASVFAVEYQEYFSGKLVNGVAESPKEALPVYCRPNFSNVWRIKSYFKVNETYNCSYSLGTFKADIYPDHLFKCPEDELSMAERMRRFLTLILSLVKSISWDGLEGWHHVLAVATGSLGGVVSSIIAVGTAHLLRSTWRKFSKKLYPLKQQVSVLAMQIRRPCILLAYVSAIGWLVLQYIQAVGLKRLLRDSLLEWL